MENNETKPVEGRDLDALKAELEKLTSENEKLKLAQSNASADASKYKKQLQERMTEQEKEAAATKELIEQLKADNQRMKREKEVSDRMAEYTGVGFEAVLAKKAAEAYGTDHDAFMVSLKAFLEAHDKEIKADAMRGTPRPGNGSTAPAITKEQFDAMTYTERVKLYDEQPEVYKQMTK